MCDTDETVRFQGGFQMSGTYLHIMCKHSEKFQRSALKTVEEVDNVSKTVMVVRNNSMHFNERDFSEKFIIKKTPQN